MARSKILVTALTSLDFEVDGSYPTETGSRFEQKYYQKRIT